MCIRDSHVGDRRVVEDVGQQREQPVAGVVPEHVRALGLAAAKPAAVHDIRVAGDDRRQEPGNVGRVVLEVCVLEDDDITPGSGDSGTQRRALAAVLPVRLEPEVTARLLRRGGVRLYEIPISYYGRTYAEGKKITWRDGLLAVGALVRFRVD